MAITSEQVWDIEEAATTAPPPGDRFVFGRPTWRATGESAHLLYDVDWNRAIRAVTTGFFDDRDPRCSTRSTVAKIGGVIVALSGIAIVTIAVAVGLGVWAISAALG
jgi:hypothetical protein